MPTNCKVTSIMCLLEKKREKERKEKRNPFGPGERERKEDRVQRIERERQHERVSACHTQILLYLL